MTERYSWGIMGAGIIAAKMADALHTNEQCDLAWVSSKSPERARSFALTHQVPGFGTYEQMLSDESLDVVYVATTNNFHYDCAMAALEAGKHVVMEKPFTVNAKQADTLIEEARIRGVFMMEAMWTRFLPLMRRMREAVQQGGIGTVQLIDICFGKRIQPEYARRLADPELGGGVTLDMGIYPLSFCSYLLGEIPEIQYASCRKNDLGVDRLAVYQLEYPGGAFAHISCGYELPMENRGVIYGTEGYITFDRFPSGDRFCLYHHQGANEISSEEIVRADHGANGFIYQVDEVVSCLQSGKLESDLMPLQESRDLIEQIDLMREYWKLVYPFEG